MSRFKDLISEQPSNTFRDKVLANAKNELSDMRKKKTNRRFWQLAFGSALSLAFISWFFRGVAPSSETSGDLLALQDQEMLQDLDVLDDLELLGDLEAEGIEI